LAILSCTTTGSEPHIINVIVTDYWGDPVDTASIGDTLYIWITANDPDKDMEYVNVKQYLNNSLVYDFDVLLPETYLETETYVGYLDILGPNGYWQNDLIIYDSRGNASNKYTIFFTVV
jgi:hypothetical protein